MSVISYTFHRQKPFPDSSHKRSVPTSDVFDIEPIIHRRGQQRTNLHSTDIRHQLHRNFLSLIHHFLLTLRKHLTRFTAKLVFHSTSSCLHHGFDVPTFSTRKGSSFAVFTMFLA